MKTIRTSSEDEMILEFLKGELQFKRFNEKLKNVLIKLKLEDGIILNGDINCVLENKNRRRIMKEFRGYPSTDLFKNFPSIYTHQTHGACLMAGYKTPLLAADDIY